MAALASPPLTDAELAAQAKALAHPARLTVLRTLAAQGTCFCGEIVDVLPLAQATVSQHLRALREAGLVRVTADGPRSCYCLDPEAVARLRDALGDLLGGLCGCASCGGKGCGCC